MTDEVAALKKELRRAYRAISGLHRAAQRGEMPDKTMLGYHAPTIGAALRFVHEGSLEGAEYFIGKKIEVLQAALRLGGSSG